MRILSLQVNDVFSFEDLYIDFNDTGLILLEGWNYDDNRANGAGKSSLFNAISFALYDKVPKKIPKKEIVRLSKKSGCVEVKIQVGPDMYAVKRCRPNKVIFYKNSEEKDFTQEEFESHIKLSYDQFLIVMYASQGDGNGRFIDLNDGSKKEFLLKLMNLSLFAQCRKRTDLLIKDLKSELETHDREIATHQASITAYSAQLIDVEVHRSSVAAIEEEVVAIGLDNARLSKIEQPDTSNFQALKEKLQAKKNEFAPLRFQVAQALSTITSCDREIQVLSNTVLEPEYKCPSCEIGLDHTSHGLVVATDIEVIKQNRDEKINTLLVQKQNTATEVQSIQVRLAEENRVDDLIAQVDGQFQTMNIDHNNAITTMKHNAQMLQSKAQNIKLVQQQIDHDSVLRANIDKLSKSKRQHETQRASVGDVISEWQAVSSMFAPTGAPAYIMDSLINVFNESINKYIQYVWPTATYCINTHKENSTGEITTKFSETLVMHGRPRSVAGLSGGEHRAMSLAVDFTMIDIINKQFQIDVNPIILDEPFEGLDATGKEIVVDLLGRISQDRQIWVVDHASEAKALFSSVKRIEKRKGISKLV